MSKDKKPDPLIMTEFSWLQNLTGNTKPTIHEQAVIDQLEFMPEEFFQKSTDNKFKDALTEIAATFYFNDDRDITASAIADIFNKHKITIVVNVQSKYLGLD